MIELDNLRQYWKQHLVHLLVGALAGVCLAGPRDDLRIAGAAIVVAQHWRQTMGFQEKKDTVSIDLMWCQAGLVIGIIVGALWSTFW